MAAAVLKKNRWFGHIYVLLFVLFGFVLFDASSVTEALKTFKALFGAGLPPVSQEALYLLRSNAVLLILAAVGATPLPKKLAEAAGRSKTGAGVIGVLEPLALAALLAVCTAFLVDGSFNPFLYFRF